jgi:hypothetical protein
MSHKKFIMVFSSILLLAWATDTVWANDPVVRTVRNPARQLGPIIQCDRAASGNICHNSTWVPTSCMTALFDAELLQNNNAAQDVLIATLEITLLIQNPAARSTRNLSAASSGPRWASPLPVDEFSTDFTLAGTATFDDPEKRVTTKSPVGQVKTGVFWSPQVSHGQAQGDSLGNVLTLGYFGPPGSAGRGKKTGERPGVHRHRIGKRDSGQRMWFRIWRNQ